MLSQALNYSKFLLYLCTLKIMYHINKGRQSQNYKESHFRQWGRASPGLRCGFAHEHVHIKSIFKVLALTSKVIY